METCPRCTKPALEQRMDYSKPVRLEILKCTACGYETVTPEQMLRNKNALKNANTP